VTERPAALDALTPVHVDVRDDLARGAEPFGKIMKAVQALGPAETLVLRAPMEPRPLYEVLARRGFAHWTERRDARDWAVWFYRSGEVVPPAPIPATGALDVRGLEPPQPMVRVLERLEALAPGETLVVVHDRRPAFLYPIVEERGFTHVTEEPQPGLVRITIRRGVA
jgi:TusA-related sulfurtransferase